MLTKQERAEIAERLKNTYYITNSTLFKALTGEEELIENDQVKELCVIASVILDLCNTSSMIELPLDKDDEVVHIGDTVYVGDKEFTVNGFMFNDNGATVRAVNTKLSTLNFFKPDELTHKKPGTIASLVSEIRHVIDRGEMTSWSMSKLFDISDQLEKLGDSDD